MGGSALTNLTSILEDVASIPGPAEWIKNLVLPQAVVQVADIAIALIQPLSWEFPYAKDLALKKNETNKQI